MSKKMCAARKKTSSSTNELFGFTYPKLHTGKNWYIDFLAFDPAEGKMKRKKYFLDSIPKIRDRRNRAAQLIEILMKKLHSGWSPWVETYDKRGFSLFSTVVEKYRKYVEKLPKEKTRRSYASMLNTMMAYIATMPVPLRYVYQYNTGFVTDFLDWLYYDREVSARTRNNYRTWCSTLAAFLVEHDYLADNPVEKIKSIAEEEKKRKALSSAQLKQLGRYLAEKDPMYLLACRMEYYTFIRPGELTSIRISDISISEQTVFVSAEHSKNGKNGKVGLNRELIHLMIDLGIFNHPGDWYLFGRKIRPSSVRGDSEQFRRRWKSVRKALKFPDELQFYSLKDSGIRDLANSAGIVIARDQARHSDVSVTNRYLNGRDLPVHDETKTFHGDL